MTLTERWYFSERNIKRYAKRALEWNLSLLDNDENKWTCMNNTRRVVKVELVKGILTFTVHVRVQENGERVWKYRKYSIIDTRSDDTPMAEGDIMLDAVHAIHPGRTGKYNFKK